MPSPVPTEVSTALAPRRAALLERATGRVLDLSETPLVDAEGRYDTIFCFVRTPAEADLDGFLVRLREHLAPDGWVYFLEPTVRTGALDRDIPPAIRRARLFVADLHRFELASVPTTFRSFVEAWARFPTPPPDPKTDDVR